MPHDPRVHLGTAAWIAREGREGLEVLLLERQGSHGAGRWALPGGWVDYYESPHRTVVREVEEETGLVVTRPRFLGHVTNVWEEEGFQVTTLVYQCFPVFSDLEPEIKEPEKASKMEWVPVHVMKSYLLFAPLHAFIDEYGRYHF